MLIVLGTAALLMTIWLAPEWILSSGMIWLFLPQLIELPSFVPIDAAQWAAVALWVVGCLVLPVGVAAAVSMLVLSPIAILSKGVFAIRVTTTFLIIFAWIEALGFALLLAASNSLRWYSALLWIPLVPLLWLWVGRSILSNGGRSSTDPTSRRPPN